MLNRVRSKETEVVVAALSRHVLKLPAALKRSLTWDRGLEMATHKNFTVATDVQVYFRDPQSPCQHGTNENTNLLLRQYFPRGTDLSGYSQEQLDRLSRQPLPDKCQERNHLPRVFDTSAITNQSDNVHAKDCVDFTKDSYDETLRPTAFVATEHHSIRTTRHPSPPARPSGRFCSS